MRRERHAVARIDREAERGRVRDLPVIGDERVGVGMRVVRREDEDAVGAVPLGLARKVGGHARTEPDARDHRHAARRCLDGGPNYRGALLGREAEELARPAGRDECVHTAARQPARVRAHRVEVDRAVGGVRRDRERQDATEERAERGGIGRHEGAAHRRTRTTMFVGFTKRSAARRRTRLVAMYTTAIASICWLGRIPGANAA